MPNGVGLGFGSAVIGGTRRMATSIIDGTVEEAVLKRSRSGIAVFESIRFQLDDGSHRTVKKAVVKQEVADEIRAGTKGRFYLYNAFDLRGVHGVRTPDGGAVYGFPTNNQKIFLILGIVSFAWIALKLFTEGGIPLLGAGLLILAIVGWTLMGKGQRESKQQFEDDAGYGASAAATGK